MDTSTLRQPFPSWFRRPANKTSGVTDLIRQRSLLWLNYLSMSAVNDRKHVRVNAHSSRDVSRFINMHEADATIPRLAGLLIPEPPDCDRNPLRARLLQLIHASLRYPFLSPSYDRTPISEAEDTIRKIWSVAYARRMPVSLPPFRPTSALDILSNSLAHVPFSDFVRFAKDGIVDLTYLSQFGTVDGNPIGGTITLRDGKIAQLSTPLFGTVDASSAGGWEVERSAAMLARSLFLHEFYGCHFFGLHYTGSMLASYLVQETRYDSLIRRLTMPFMYDAIALLTEQLPVTTDIHCGNVRTLSTLSADGCVDFFKYAIQAFSLKNEYTQAQALYPATFGALERAVAEFIGPESNAPVLQAPELDAGGLNTVQKLAWFCYTSSVNHYRYGYMGKPILPYLNLVADEEKRQVFVYGLIFTLSVFFAATLEKSMLVDDFGYLMANDDEKRTFTKVQDVLKAMAAATPGMPVDGVNTAINN